MVPPSAVLLNQQGSAVSRNNHYRSNVARHRTGRQWRRYRLRAIAARRSNASPASRAPRLTYAAPVRDLGPLFDPRSVAVLGASDDPTKWGQRISAGALRGAHRREVWLVNRKGGQILGRDAYTSLAELPGEPDLVVISLREFAFEQAIDDCARRRHEGDRRDHGRARRDRRRRQGARGRRRRARPGRRCRDGRAELPRRLRRRRRARRRLEQLHAGVDRNHLAAATRHLKLSRRSTASCCSRFDVVVPGDIEGASCPT